MDKSKFNKAILYLAALRDQVERINEEFGVDDNDILFYHYFEENDKEHHYQFVYRRHPEFTHSKQPWEFNIYTEGKDVVNDRVTYVGSTPKELLEHIEAGIVYKR